MSLEIVPAAVASLDSHEIALIGFRWIHVVAGVLWIGLLYFFNWVNSAFAPTMDAETKKKVVPELLPRALFWFRWGAAYTWIFGVLLLFMMYYTGDSGNFVSSLDPASLPEGLEPGLAPPMAIWGMAFGAISSDSSSTTPCSSS